MSALDLADAMRSARSDEEKARTEAKVGQLVAEGWVPDKIHLSRFGVAEMHNAGFEYSWRKPGAKPRKMTDAEVDLQARHQRLVRREEERKGYEDSRLGKMETTTRVLSPTFDRCFSFRSALTAFVYAGWPVVLVLAVKDLVS